MSKLNIVTREFTTKDTEGVATGLREKHWNACRALDINLTHTLDDVQGICLIDPLWLWEQPDTEERWHKLQELNAIKIIWAEEQELLRWKRDRRMEFVRHVDYVTCCNKFLQNILEEFGIKSDILYTPIDENYWSPAEEKTPVLLASGKLSVEKGAERYIELFQLLDCEIVYTGHAGLWNETPKPHERELERELSKHCTWIKYASRNKMRELYSSAICYVNLARYDVGCLTFLQAGSSGCHCVIWLEHRQFDEYVNFKSAGDVAHAADLIEEIMVGDMKPNTALRKEIMKKHSLDAFRTNLKSIISNTVGV